MMLMMEKDNEIRDKLQPMVPQFQNIVKSGIETLLQIECSVNEPWNVTPKINGSFDHVITLGNGNKDYQAILSIGLKDECIRGFLGNTVSSEDILDAFGEISNNICALIMDTETFTNHFGILRQSVPLYSQGETYFLRAWGIEGMIYYNNIWIYSGYAIRKSSI